MKLSEIIFRSFLLATAVTLLTHERRQRGAMPPWIFIHGTDIVDRGLIVLLYGLF